MRLRDGGPLEHGRREGENRGHRGREGPDFKTDEREREISVFAAQGKNTKAV